ncbi:hypothetical protein JX265_011549 [Neoarthrinium moseri]|uniref:Uncharacterized protein n=1 Tax=Neoarthrinium moseri TaxID=1658444 RepID=A0A9P9WC92_9PEZI|nr:uncharacterized protein JN550_011701 [Neoarthrinium moseri]KAI1848597.1 hypothetical protein JX266_005456 [Neoarthrinium moseri]KAI1856590.1 hypothetical protein JX265_011549 [Neoarthrinium moseri]KAI1860017.1 hypothetical protein JN550_011701 [Neoarthrinium moseri]
MKPTPTFGFVATLSTVALAQTLQGRQNATVSQFGTCKFDRTTAFQLLKASEKPVAQIKRRACSGGKRSKSSSAVSAVAPTSQSLSSSHDTSMSIISSSASSSTATSAVFVSMTDAIVTTAASSTPTSAWQPPSSISAALEEVWEHEMSTYGRPLEFKNFGYDHLMDTQARIQYCVRWDSTQVVTAEQRDKLETALQRQYNKWVEGALAGFDGFPYSTANIKIVGWATNNTALFEGNVTAGVTLYSTTTDVDGIPQCDPACGRAIHYVDGDYSGCTGGNAARYDVSLWLTDGMDDSGFGGDWGQRIGTNYMLENLESENIEILLHEIGHTLALDDFYDWTPPGVSNFIMRAGSSAEVTEFDVWMVRDWWRHLKSRYNL